MDAESRYATDVGNVREHNEDAVHADDGAGIYLVADGVGGHAKGEIASQETVTEVAAWAREHLSDMDALLAQGGESDLAQLRRTVSQAIQQTCYLLFGISEQDPSKRGMSTTLSLLILRGEHAIIAQVGDSRVYRLRDQQVEQLTEDHTLLNYRKKQGLPVENFKKKNVITRAVGFKEYVVPDVTIENVQPGDTYLLCSDGLHGYVEEEQELNFLMTMRPLQAAVDRSIEIAKTRGGRDNITSLLVAV